MKVSVNFNGQGLRLVLTPDTDAEQKMVGAVLNAPGADRQSQVCADLLRGEFSYEGHYTSQKVKELRIFLHRDEALSHD